MIIVRSPLRISIAGGGTDIPSYYKINESFFISAAINKYIYISITKPFQKGIYLKYLSHALRELGHTVDVLSGEPYPQLDDGCRLIRLPGLNLYASNNHLHALRWRHLRSYTDTFEWLSMATGGFPEPYTWGRRAASYLRTRRSDYDIIHDNQSLSYGLLALQRWGFPVVATIHHHIVCTIHPSHGG